MKGRFPSNYDICPRKSISHSPGEIGYSIVHTDPEGKYIKRWLPELECIDPKGFTKPPEKGEKLSADYFEPIVDHGEERLEPLERFKRHKMK